MIDRERLFSSCVCSLKETSKSNHDGVELYITESELEVVNFDKVKDNYIKSLAVPEPPASVDALYHKNDDEIYLIEFKYGTMRSDKVHQVRLKVFDSLMIYSDITGQTISETREKVTFVLVYNETLNPLTDDEINELQISPSRVDIATRYLNKSGKHLIRFNLERFQKLCFRDVYTVGIDEFSKDFVGKWQS